MGAEGRVDWVQRPDGSRPWFHKSERTHSAKGNSSSDSSSSREAPDTAGNLGSVTPAQEMQKTHTIETPVVSPQWWWRLKGDGAGFPLELTRSFSLEGCGPMRRSPWRGGHTRTVASGPSGTTTDLCPFFKPSQNQVLAPLQEASVPRPGLLEAGPRSPPPSRTSSEGAGRAHRPSGNRFTQRALSRSQGSFP